MAHLVWKKVALGEEDRLACMVGAQSSTRGGTQEGQARAEGSGQRRGGWGWHGRNAVGRRVGAARSKLWA